MKRIFPFSTSLSHQFKAFAFVLTCVTALALSHTWAIGGGHIWREHERAGTLLLQGQIPEVPTYPMWGYSFLAAIFGTNLFFLEAAFTLLVLLLWYRTHVKNMPPTKWSWAKGAAAALALASWVFLADSYYSNSLGQTFLLLGIWFMFLAVRQPDVKHSFWYLILSAFLTGIALNFRTEYLVFVGLLAISLLLYGAYERKLKEGVVRASIFMGIILLLLVPWLIYTNATVGHPLFTSTNGGAVRYHGLGVLPNNPWGVVSRDPFVTAIAERELNASPWSYEAHLYFNDLFMEAITDHPDAFVKRVFIGWRLMFMQGVYTPDLRLWAAQSPTDTVLFDYAHEVTKQKLGLHVNHLQMTQYLEQGIGIDDLEFRHYGILAAEYFLRFLFLIAFLSLFAMVLMAMLQQRLHPFLVLLCSSAVIYLLFLSGLAQANPRHTTLVLPVFATAVLAAQPISSHISGRTTLRKVYQTITLQALRFNARPKAEK